VEGQRVPDLVSGNNIQQLGTHMKVIVTIHDGRRYPYRPLDKDGKTVKRFVSMEDLTEWLIQGVKLGSGSVIRYEAA
jgi:hypothetical protein